MELHNADVPPRPAAGGLSRRKVMTGAGVALAGAAAAGVAGAAPAEAVDSGSIAATQPGGTVLEFVCRITQNGLQMNGIGYLTQVAGLNDRELFTDPAQRDESHARFVATATGTVVARSVEDKVTALDVDGALNVYYNSGGGASWSDATSFARGTQVAGYTLDLQDILTVIAPQTGLPTLNGAAPPGHDRHRPGPQVRPEPTDPAVHGHRAGQPQRQPAHRQPAGNPHRRRFHDRHLTRIPGYHDDVTRHAPPDPPSLRPGPV